MPRPHTGVAVDLRRGLGYVVKRRAKLLVYVVTAAAFLVNNGLVHGDLAEGLNVAIALAGAYGVHQVPNARAAKRR